MVGHKPTLPWGGGGIGQVTCLLGPGEGQGPPLACEQNHTHTSENIIFPSTTYVFGNKICLFGVIDFFLSNTVVFVYFVGPFLYAAKIIFSGK